APVETQAAAGRGRNGDGARVEDDPARTDPSAVDVQGRRPILLPRHEGALSVERHLRVLLHAPGVRDLDAAGIEERPAGRQTGAVDLSGLLPDELAPHDQEV